MEINFDTRLSYNDLEQIEKPAGAEGSFESLGRELALGVKVPLTDFDTSLSEHWVFTGEAAYKHLSDDDKNKGSAVDTAFVRLGIEYRRKYFYAALKGGIGFSAIRTDFGQGRYSLPRDFNYPVTGSFEVGGRYCFGDRVCLRGFVGGSYEHAVGGEARSRYTNWTPGVGVGVDFAATPRKVFEYRLDKANQTIVLLQIEVGELKAENFRLRAALADLRERFATLTDKSEGQTKKIRRLEGELDASQSTAQERGGTIKEQLSEISRLSRENASLRAQLKARPPVNPTGGIQRPTGPDKEVVLFVINGDEISGQKKVTKSGSEGIRNPQLDLIAERLRADSSLAIRIKGHASRSGPESYNQKLSDRRAKAVESYLTSKSGVNRSQILEAKGYGTSKQPVPEKPESEANQAVTITFARKDQTP